MNAMVSTVAFFRGVSKSFRNFWGREKVRALRGVTFDARRGEILGLLGPNGSGKSTALKILLGLLVPDEGEVSVFGVSPREVPVKAQIGYLPEENRLYPALTPKETLNFYGALFGLDRRETRRRTGQLLEMTGLVHAADRPVGEFSKGMARRIGLAQALLNDPELLVLDEPTSGLDPVGCRQVKDLLLELAGRGKTVILSSHLLADVESICDRMVILFNGTVIAQGCIGEMLSDSRRRKLVLEGVASRELDEIVSSLRERFGLAPEVEVPTVSLEQFFLQAIENARAGAGHVLSGVEPVGGVAEYLTGSPASASSPDDYLRRLSEAGAASEPGAGGAVATSASSPATGAADPDEKLEQLLGEGRGKQ